MSDSLHDAFEAWITANARGDLPRDVAIHADGCGGCAASIAAVDALLLVDIDAAGEPPPVRRAVPRPPVAAPIRLARTIAGAVAVVLIAGAATIGITSLLPDRAGVGQPSSAPRATAETAEGVLGGVGRSGTTPSPTGSPTPSPSESVEPDDSEAATTPPPEIAGQPLPPAFEPTPGATRTFTPATPRPTAAATPRPPQPTAKPTQPPSTPVPTPAPTTPPPTPTPPPPQCSDGVDNDGDTFIDWPLDLGCVTADDNDESGPFPLP